MNRERETDIQVPNQCYPSSGSSVLVNFSGSSLKVFICKKRLCKGGGLQKASSQGDRLKLISDLLINNIRLTNSVAKATGFEMLKM